jgi:hypothetical protein
MYEHTLTGNVYTVHVRMTVDSYKDYSRGDHYAGGGEYTVSYGTGEATIRDPTGQTIAVCGLDYSRTDPRGGWLREVSDAVFKRCVEVEGLLSDRQKAYVDWLAERWIECFRKSDQGGMPRLDLVEPDRAELIELGFVLDPNGQSSLPLHDVRSPASA